MKRNNLFYLAIATFGLSMLTGCRNENDTLANGEETILSFRPTVEDMNQESVTRAASNGNNFFKEGDKISISVTTNRTDAGTTEHTYTHGIYEGKEIFTGDFRFKLDNTYIKELVALWPSKDTRQEDGIILDQRDGESFKQADRLRAVSSNLNIMPTATPIPLTFKHEQSKFSFRLAGQNANGLNIQSIILELQYPDTDPDNPETTKTVSGAFWAYCPGDNTAGLILVPGTSISTNNPSYQIDAAGRYMIGQVKVGEGKSTQYTGGIWLKSDVDITLAPGIDYLVTLTPEGYNLIATIEIGDFAQNEGYVGIPIQMPTLATGTTDTYEIKNTTQLVTLSRLLRGGYIANQDADTWKGYKYVIQNGIVITSAWQYYLPIDVALQSHFEDETGNAITRITYNEESYNLFGN